MARTYGAPRRRSSVDHLPSVAAVFLAGGRITLGVAWQVTLFGEYLMGTPGVGFQVNGDQVLDTAPLAWDLDRRAGRSCSSTACSVRRSVLTRICGERMITIDRV